MKSFMANARVKDTKKAQQLGRSLKQEMQSIIAFSAIGGTVSNAGKFIDFHGLAANFPWCSQCRKWLL